ncbi:MAG: hypothetical protein K6C69_06110 [Lachnospiraceae bacterium]|nr:hypothetical protein [Lachnospiraceae bacterium]
MEFIEYADLITDAEAEGFDQRAYEEYADDIRAYYKKSCYYKNQRVAQVLDDTYDILQGYVLDDMLGVNRTALEEQGYSYVEVKKYFSPVVKRNHVSPKPSPCEEVPIFVATYQGIKYAFIGSLGRVRQYIDLEWQFSKEETRNYADGIFDPTIDYVTTVHKVGQCHIPRNGKYKVHMMVDGYIPVNNPDMGLKFEQYDYPLYVTNRLQMDGIKNTIQKEAQLFPTSKKMVFPQVDSCRRIKKVLVASNCAGPWSSLINISDTDRLVEATAKLAMHYPDIEFVFRHHPSADNPMHEGIHSVERVKEYIEYLNLPNFIMSCNSQKMNEERKYISVREGTLEEEIKNADVVLSEYSNTMIEAALMGVPFITVNLTGRRNLFQSVTNFGFPYCETYEALVELLQMENRKVLWKQYNAAIRKINEYWIS